MLAEPPAAPVRPTHRWPPSHGSLSIFATAAVPGKWYHTGIISAWH